MSFTAGFKLAWGVAGEPGVPYSYDTDEEQKVQDTHRSNNTPSAEWSSPRCSRHC